MAFMATSCIPNFYKLTVLSPHIRLRSFSCSSIWCDTSIAAPTLASQRTPWHEYSSSLITGLVAESGLLHTARRSVKSLSVSTNQFTADMARAFFTFKLCFFYRQICTIPSPPLLDCVCWKTILFTCTIPRPSSPTRRKLTKNNLKTPVIHL